MLINDATIITKNVINEFSGREILKNEKIFLSESIRHYDCKIKFILKNIKKEFK